MIFTHTCVTLRSSAETERESNEQHVKRGHVEERVDERRRKDGDESLDSLVSRYISLNPLTLPKKGQASPI